MQTRSQERRGWARRIQPVLHTLFKCAGVMGIRPPAVQYRVCTAHYTASRLWSTGTLLQRTSVLSAPDHQFGTLIQGIGAPWPRGCSGLTACSHHVPPEWHPSLQLMLPAIINPAATHQAPLVKAVLLLLPAGIKQAAGRLPASGIPCRRYRTLPPLWVSASCLPQSPSSGRCLISMPPPGPTRQGLPGCCMHQLPCGPSAMLQTLSSSFSSYCSLVQTSFVGRMGMHVHAQTCPAAAGGCSPMHVSGACTSCPMPAPCGLHQQNMELPSPGAIQGTSSCIGC